MSSQDPPPFPPFPLARSERIYDSYWCGLRRDMVELDDGRLQEYHVFEIHDAVAVVPVLPDGSIVMLWQFRHPHGKTHWEIPAGRVDEGETPLEAARREAREEIGLEIAAETFLGRLDDYPTRSGYLITPLVAWVAAGARIAPNPAEVEQVYRVPLAELGREGSPQFVSIAESDRPVVRYPLLGSLIHAPTAAVLYQFMEVALFGRDTRVAHLEQPVWAWR